MTEDFYKILGVDKKSDSSQIKKAYRKLSKKYHPDVNPNGEKEFKKITEAYETLSDPQKRDKYDNPASGFGGFGSGDMGDMFNQFFGQRQRSRQRVRRKTPEKIVDISINIEDSFLGNEIDIKYNASESCSSCSGRGGDSTSCGVCHGSGHINRQVGNGFISQIVQQQCPNCQGAGYQLLNFCGVCNGKGKKVLPYNLSVKIPVGTDEGEMLRVPGKGDYLTETGFGDVILKVNFKKHKCFEKVTNDLIFNLDIDCETFLNSDTIEVEHPAGDLTINLPNELHSNKPLRVKGKGFRKNNLIGDFYVKMNVFRKEKLIS